MACNYYSGPLAIAAGTMELGKGKRPNKAEKVNEQENGERKESSGEGMMRQSVTVEH